MTADRPATGPTDRFWEKVDRTAGADGCWPWLGSLTPDGYGQFWAGAIKGRAHRYSYSLVNGPIPEGLQTDHLCRNRACVNPAHLEAVTPRENTMRSEGPAAINARKTECPKGHPLSGDNLVVNATTGYRRCRTCMVEHTRERWGAAMPKPRWSAWVNGERVPFRRVMVGFDGWDARCGCGWDTATGGAPRLKVRAALYAHQDEAHGGRR